MRIFFLEYNEKIGRNNILDNAVRILELILLEKSLNYFFDNLM